MKLFIKLIQYMKLKTLIPGMSKCNFICLKSDMAQKIGFQLNELKISLLKAKYTKKSNY